MFSSESTTQPFVVQRKSRVKPVVCSFLGLVVALLLVYGAISILSEGPRRPAGVALSMALFVVTVSTNPWFNQNSSKVGPAVLNRVRGSTVQYEPWGLRWRSVVVASVALLTWFTLWFLVPLFLSFYVALVLRSVRNGWLELDADGVHHRGWSFEKTATWDSVRTVQIEDRRIMYPQAWRSVVHQCVALKPVIVLSGSHRHTARLWRIENMPLFTIDLDCRRFDVHPVVLQQWIAFYLHNPKMRHELGTDAAAQRLAAITV